MLKKHNKITITRNPTDSSGSFITPWYEKYRITDEEYLKKTNEIWKEIISRVR